MSSGSYLQVYVKCPFYSTDNGRSSITCEGIIPDTRVVNLFRHRKEFKIQIETFCCNAYTNCEVHEAIQQKYEEEAGE